VYSWTQDSAPGLPELLLPQPFCPEERLAGESGFPTFEGNVYGFATMSNSTRSSSFTFTAPPPKLMGSIPKSLCFSWAEP